MASEYASLTPRILRLVAALLIAASVGSVAWSIYALGRADVGQERERRAVEAVRGVLRERGWLELSPGFEAPPPPEHAARERQTFHLLHLGDGWLEPAARVRLACEPE